MLESSKAGRGKAEKIDAIVSAHLDLYHNNRPLLQQDKDEPKPNYLNIQSVVTILVPRRLPFLWLNYFFSKAKGIDKMADEPQKRTRVFFDISIGNKAEGRITFELYVSWFLWVGTYWPY